MTAKPENWSVYNYSSYEAAFPSKPENTSTSVGDFGYPSTTHTAIASDGSSYVLTVTLFPHDLAANNAKEILATSVKDRVERVNGTLVGAIDTRNATGYDSIDFVINLPDGASTYMGRNILNGDTLYEMAVVYLNTSSPEYRGFVDSFELK